MFVSFVVYEINPKLPFFFSEQKKIFSRNQIKNFQKESEMENQIAKIANFTKEHLESLGLKSLEKPIFDFLHFFGTLNSFFIFRYKDY